jgi:hypothetical protein
LPASRIPSLGSGPPPPALTSSSSRSSGGGGGSGGSEGGGVTPRSSSRVERMGSKLARMLSFGKDKAAKQ